MVANAQNEHTVITFKSKEGSIIKVTPDNILIDGNTSYYITKYDIILSSKRNKILENGGSTFLFLEGDGSPNLDRLLAFKIQRNNISLIANAISSDLKDLDGDGNLEFGGSDLTEMHPSRDSMYYIPSDYYKIRNGVIIYDSLLTRKIDKEVNGIYLLNAEDENGYCCVAIIKPHLKKPIVLMNPPIISERIDGPANIRDTINGSIILSLDDNIPVSTSVISKNWFKIAFSIDLDNTEYVNRVLPNGSTLYRKSKKIGTVLKELRLPSDEVNNTKGVLSTSLIGYTSKNNIKSETQPESALGQILNQSSVLTIAELSDYIKGYQFSQIKIDNFNCFQLDYGNGDGPSSPIRVLLVFYNNLLIGVVHSESIDFKWTKSRSAFKQNKYELTFSIIGSQDSSLKEKFFTKFQEWISHLVDIYNKAMDPNTPNITVLEGTASGYDPDKNILTWNPTEGIRSFDGKTEISPTTLLNHELDHGVQAVTNPSQFQKDSKSKDDHYDDKEGKRVITTTEQKTALALGEIKSGETTRTNHLGFDISTAGPTTTKTEAKKNKKR